MFILNVLSNVCIIIGLSLPFNGRNDVLLAEYVPLTLYIPIIGIYLLDTLISLLNDNKLRKVRTIIKIFSLISIIVFSFTVDPAYWFISAGGFLFLIGLLLYIVYITKEYKYIAKVIPELIIDSSCYNINDYMCILSNILFMLSCCLPIFYIGKNYNFWSVGFLDVEYKLTIIFYVISFLELLFVVFRMRFDGTPLSSNFFVIYDLFKMSIFIYIFTRYTFKMNDDILSFRIGMPIVLISIGVMLSVFSLLNNYNVKKIENS